MKVAKTFQALKLLSVTTLLACTEHDFQIIEKGESVTVLVERKYNCNIPIGGYALLSIENPNDSIGYVWISENSDIASCNNDTIFGHRVGTTKVLNANVTDIKYEITVNVINKIES